MHLVIGLIIFIIASFIQPIWEQIAPGLEHRKISMTLPEYDYPIVINAVRIDPQKLELVFMGIS